MWQRRGVLPADCPACHDRYLSVIDIVWVTQSESDTGDLRTAELEKIKDLCNLLGSW